MDHTPDVTIDAQTALRSGDWEAARDAYLDAVALGPDGAAYEGLAQALWWLNDGVGCLEAREDAYAVHREVGDDVAAAISAASLGYDSLLFGQGEAVARGWFGLATDLLEGQPECAAHGWLAARQAEFVLATPGDAATAERAAQQALEIGQRTGDRDLVHVGTALTGLARTIGGEPRSGVPQLDRAVAAASTGGVSDAMWMGKIFCWLIIACQELHDLTRADEWCRRVDAICQRRHLAPLLTVCRIQHSSVLINRGTWVKAEKDLIDVLDTAQTAHRHGRLDAVVQLGELRRRQGRWAEAEELLAQAEFDPAAIVSRALIRLAQGSTDQAWGDIRGVLAALPESQRLLRAQFLLPAVRAAHGAGATTAALAAAAELKRTAEQVGNRSLTGLAFAAEAILASPVAAVALWRDAVRCFHEAQLPFNEAESRLKLAAALLEIADTGAAEEQLASAVTQLRSLGAGGALHEARELGRRIAVTVERPADGGLTTREIEVLALVAAGMTNRQIATSLTLSPHTVHRHMAHILTKLNQTTRAGATAYALSHRIL